MIFVERNSVWKSFSGDCQVADVHVGAQRTDGWKLAEDVKASGAGLLRGGAFKPRTSPYSFQGLGSEGLKLLLEAKKATGLPIVTEIMRCSASGFIR